VESLLPWLLENKAEIWSAIAGFLTGGSLLTVWKYLSGANNVNLSLELQTRRTPSGAEGRHDLVCLLKLKKGDRATLRLQTVAFFSKCGSSQDEQKHKVNLCVVAGKAERQLNITPGEETHFAVHFVVKATEVCSVRAEVKGQGLAWRRVPIGVWHASEVSVPHLPGANSQSHSEAAATLATVATSE